MIIVPPEIEQLARLVAARSGKTPEDVLKDGVAMEARIVGVAITETAKPRVVNLNRVHEIMRRVSSQPVRDPRPAREICDEAWGSSG